ncbi:hypothetical protein Sjap_020451 [Stephania japonica]|uniref:NAC domain-containing protein n=1 Tax=Stephania japonica TaxID=461633 RepID=A0AAP0HZ07_9MAGN
MNTFSHVPPGFRFHPTDEELVDYYLRKKIASRRIDLDVIKDVDLYKIEPWDLQEKCKIGTEEQNDWYFFSHKDKKYPTGTRTNRATTAGFWKATGRDKAIYSKHNLIEEGWVVCRVFKKRMTAIRKASEHGSPCWYDEQVSFMPELDSPKRVAQPDHHMGYHHHAYPCKQELELQYQIPHESFLQLPQLESPKLPQHTTANVSNCNSINIAYGLDINHGKEQMQQSHHQRNINSLLFNNKNEQVADQVTDWRILDKFVASQLSQDEVSKEANFSNAANVFHMSEQMNITAGQSTNQQEMGQEYASTSASSSCQIDLWK